MAACLLILFYVNYEKKYDEFHKDNHRIYRLRYDRTSEEGQIVQFASCCPPAAEPSGETIRKWKVLVGYSDTERLSLSRTGRHDLPKTECILPNLNFLTSSILHSWNAGLFLIPLILVSAVTFVTMCGNILKVVRINPVDTIKHE